MKKDGGKSHVQMQKILNKRMKEEKMSVADLERVMPGRKDIYSLLDYGYNGNANSDDLDNDIPIGGTHLLDLMIVGENKLSKEAESAMRIQQDHEEGALLIDREFLDGKRTSN